MTATPLDQTFAALGDGTRRAILARLTLGETALSEIAAPFAMSQTAVSKHVRVLSDAGLVRVTKRGRTRYCRLEAAPMKAAAEWLESYQAFWEDQFDALAKHLEESP
jgi:DNA-binding transcriptional ArsR family regulator